MVTAALPLEKFQSAQRINRSITAAAEKRLLEWLAAHAPAWVTSDGLTILGLAAQFAAGACFAAARWNRAALLGVIPCLVLNWLGDSLDGTLARVRGQQRPRYGFYVDHVVDIFGATALLAGLGLSGIAHWQAAGAMLVGFLLLSAESYLATYTLGDFKMSQGIFGPTELRILLCISTVRAFCNPMAVMFGHRFLLFDIGGYIGAVGMVILVIAAATIHTLELYRAEPLPAALSIALPVALPVKTASKSVTQGFELQRPHA